MFGFRKKRTTPLCKSNPGIGVNARVAFATGERSWVEEVNMVSLAQAVFEGRGYSVKNEKTWLLHRDSGFAIYPQFVEAHPLDRGGAQTTTTAQTNHPTLAPAGIFEYQHATGDHVAESISKGLDQWVQTDFVPLLDALRDKPEHCTFLEASLPAAQSKPARIRRAVLGPVAHYMQNPPNTPDECASEEHGFCPCCLLTKSFHVFKPLFEDDGFYGLRLFAARDAEGAPQADCRVNGEDFEEGAQALREYVTTWPRAGYEFRKQYVVLQSVRKSAAAERAKRADS
jgi:hypothetical protein